MNEQETVSNQKNKSSKQHFQACISAGLPSKITFQHCIDLEHSR